MNKLLLTGLLVTGLTTQAEEFKPTASWDLQYKYYGKAEEGVTGKNNGNEGARIQNLIKAQFTANDSLEIRIRDFDNYNGTNSRMSRRDDTEVRIRAFHKFTDIGGVKQTGRLQYRKNGTNRHVEYGHQFNFAGLLFDNQLVKTTNFTLMPSYRYVFSDSTHTNTLGLDLYTYHKLPDNIGLEVNVYTRRDEGTKPENFSYNVEAYLYKTIDLYRGTENAVTLELEGGLDDYSSVAKREISELSLKDGSYSLYAFPHVKYSHTLKQNLTFYVAAGGEYRNFAHTKYTEAKDFRWQPIGFAGAKLVF
jgi:hypothetical protein